MRPFRFSLQVRDAAGRAEWAELARRAEGAGCALLVVPDHLDACLSPLASLVAAAEAAPALRVGTLVLNNDFRHPALLAREAATVDLLTGGRFELGLGAGHAAEEYRRAGLAFDPAPVRVGRLEESVGIVRRLLDGETVDAAGRHYRLAGETCHPRPVQAHVPLLVGAGVGRRMLALAARTADTVGFTGVRIAADAAVPDVSGFAPAAVDAQVAWVRAQAGDRLGAIELHALVQRVLVTDRARAAAEELVATVVPSLAAGDVLASPFVLIGSVGAMVEGLLARRERWGFSHYTVRPDGLAAFSAVIAALAGR